MYSQETCKLGGGVFQIRCVTLSVWGVCRMLLGAYQTPVLQHRLTPAGRRSLQRSRRELTIAWPPMNENDRCLVSPSIHYHTHTHWHSEGDMIQCMSKGDAAKGRRISGLCNAVLQRDHRQAFKHSICLVKRSKEMVHEDVSNLSATSISEKTLPLIHTASRHRTLPFPHDGVACR